MTERGEPKNLVADVEDKRADDAAVVADVEDKRAADVEAVKGPIKRIVTLMMSLIGPADWCEEAALMYQILGEELSKIKITTLNMDQIMQLLEEEENNNI